MITVFSDQHWLRHARTELHDGELVAPFETPRRAEDIRAAVEVAELGTIVPPHSFSLDPVARVHDGDYLEFLSSCWNDWVAEGHQGEAIANIWPTSSASSRMPTSVSAKIGHYALAADTAISEGTWEAAIASAQVALTGQALIAEGAQAAFALCRPPGHHATTNKFGGYCFLNNAAIAAQAFLDQGAERVAILDVDYHHGNGTQEIFYSRSDVLTVSIHGDPVFAYPYYTGYSEEIGVGGGEGFNHNFPLPAGTDFATWRSGLADLLVRITDFSPDALVVSLGVDTFEGDPISDFRLTSDDFGAYGRMLGAQGVPTLFVMEGGYAVAEIGVNVKNVLAGFLERN